MEFNREYFIAIADSLLEKPILHDTSSLWEKRTTDSASAPQAAEAETPSAVEVPSAPPPVRQRPRRRSVEPKPSSRDVLYNAVVKMAYMNHMTFEGAWQRLQADLDAVLQLHRAQEQTAEAQEEEEQHRQTAVKPTSREVLYGIVLKMAKRDRTTFDSAAQSLQAELDIVLQRYDARGKPLEREPLYGHINAAISGEFYLSHFSNTAEKSSSREVLHDVLLRMSQRNRMTFVDAAYRLKTELEDVLAMHRTQLEVLVRDPLFAYIQIDRLAADLACRLEDFEIACRQVAKHMDSKPNQSGASGPDLEDRRYELRYLQAQVYFQRGYTASQVAAILSIGADMAARMESRWRLEQRKAR